MQWEWGGSSTTEQNKQTHFHLTNNNLRILVLNCNSLINTRKQAKLLHLIDQHQPNVSSSCETKLSPINHDNESFPTNHYIVFRKDNKRREVGVFIATKCNLGTIHEASLDSDCEIIQASILVRGKSLILGSFYHCPTMNTVWPSTHYWRTRQIPT